MKVDLTKEQIEFINYLCFGVEYDYKNYSPKEQQEREDMAESIRSVLEDTSDDIDEEELDELAESMSKGFWSDDLESFEDNPQRSLIIWTAKRIYECGIKNGYRKAKEK